MASSQTHFQSPTNSPSCYRSAVIMVVNGVLLIAALYAHNYFYRVNRVMHRLDGTRQARLDELSFMLQGSSNKTLVIVGNTPSLHGRHLGPSIDRYDDVLRTERFQLHGLEDSVGSKTTLWLVGGETQLTEWADSSSLKGVSVAIFPYTTRDPEAVRGVADADRRRLSAWIQQEVPQARTKVWAGALSERRTLQETYQLADNLVTAGAEMLSFLISKYRKVALVGFDCQEELCGTHVQLPTSLIEEMRKKGVLHDVDENDATMPVSTSTSLAHKDGTKPDTNSILNPGPRTPPQGSSPPTSSRTRSRPPSGSSSSSSVSNSRDIPVDPSSGGSSHQSRREGNRLGERDSARPRRSQRSRASSGRDSGDSRDRDTTSRPDGGDGNDDSEREDKDVVSERLTDSARQQTRYVKGPNGVPIPVPNQRDVVVVGSGPSLLGSGLGATIDTFKKVVRFNLFKTKNFTKDVGSKTTTWVMSSIKDPDEMDVDEIRGVKKIYFPLSRMAKANTVALTKKRFQQSKKMPSGIAVWAGVWRNEINILYQKYRLKEKHVSSGLQALVYFGRRYHNVYFAGFDFERSDHQHYWEIKVKNATCHNMQGEAKALQMMASNKLVHRLQSNDKGGKIDFEKYDPNCKILCNKEGFCKKLIGGELKHQNEWYNQGMGELGNRARFNSGTEDDINAETDKTESR